MGILRDEAGNDTYSAMRMSKGFGTAQGVGIHHDLTGDDVYEYYMPRPLNPDAPYKTPGSGGGLTTTGLCDSQPRWDEGVGIFGGVGILVDDGGDDIYRAAAPLDHLFGTEERPRRTGSLGFGDQGLGVMLDRAGRDAYFGMPGRRDGLTIAPSGDSVGVFVDSGQSAGSPAHQSAPDPGDSATVTALNVHFVPDTVTVPRGGALLFANIDSLGRLESLGHTVTELRGGGGPRFSTPVVDFGQAVPVEGVADLDPGRYQFFCEIHPFMDGTLIIE